MVTLECFVYKQAPAILMQFCLKGGGHLQLEGHSERANLRQGQYALFCKVKESVREKKQP